MSRVLSGRDFNELYPNTKFYKLTNQLETHNGFKYTDGLNNDTILFNPYGSCSPGGLYFTEYDKIPLWINYANQSMCYIREVIIPYDARIYIEENKIKTNKFYLSPRKLIEEFEGWDNHEYCLSAVKLNGFALEYVKEQTEEICLAAVNKNGRALQYIKEQTDEICLQAVKQYA
jgi:hypothetical protein